MAFIVGQRVIFQDRRDPVQNWFHAASMGLTGIVMHLNAKQPSGRVRPISGRVLKIRSDTQGTVYLDFRPDGWLITEGDGSQGFQAESKYFKPYPDDWEAMPGRITDAMGKPVTDEQIRKAFEIRDAHRQESIQQEKTRAEG